MSLKRNLLAEIRRRPRMKSTDSNLGFKIKNGDVKHLFELNDVFKRISKRRAMIEAKDACVCGFAWSTCG